MSLSKVFPKLPDSAQPFCCKHCHARIGHTTANSLWIGDIEIFVAFKFRCLMPGCFKVTLWTPIRAKVLSLAESASVQLP